MCMANKVTENVYEVSFHLLPTLDEGAVSNSFSSFKDAVAQGGKVLSEVLPEPQDLAYTIQHTVRQASGVYGRYDTSYFGSIKFAAAPDFVSQVEQVFSGNEQVLRFLLVETVADDTRIGEVLPGSEPEEGDADDAGAAEGAEGDDSEQESGIADHPDEEDGEKSS